MTTQQTQSTQISTLDFKPTGRGVIICEASNTEGKSEARANVIANDLTEYFSIVSNNDVPVVVGDKVTVVCAASAFKYTDMNWFKGNVLVTNSSRMYSNIENSITSQLTAKKMFNFRSSSDNKTFTTFTTKRDPLEFH